MTLFPIECKSSKLPCSCTPDIVIYILQYDRKCHSLFRYDRFLAWPLTLVIALAVILVFHDVALVLSHLVFEHLRVALPDSDPGMVCSVFAPEQTVTCTHSVLLKWLLWPPAIVHSPRPGQ